MKICPKCETNHNKFGIFCSRPCANSRHWSEEDKKKKDMVDARNHADSGIAQAEKMLKDNADKVEETDKTNNNPSNNRFSI